jgi:Putative MetA-pathway of phenol degradation
MAHARPIYPAVLGLAVLAVACRPGLRAQVTESPVTIAPGSVLMRMDAISLGLEPNSAEPNQYRALALGTAIVSAGLTDSVDFEAGTQLFLRNTFTTSGSDHTQSGVGEFTFRTKWTFWRDPATGQEAAVVPYVVVPVNSSVVGNDFVEGGVILPWARDFGAGFRAEAMAEWDEFRNVSNTRYDTRWYGSAAAQWDFGGRIGAYAEATLGLSTAGSASDTGTLGAGATLSISKDFQWDLEVSKVIGPGRNQWAEVLRFRWKIL